MAVLAKVQKQINGLKQWPKLRRGVYLYLLIDPSDNRTRYVGQTANPFNRMREHLLCAGGDTLNAETKRAWLARLYLTGLIPEMRIVAIVEKAVAISQETALIRVHLSAGCVLFNAVRSCKGQRLPSRISARDLELYGFKITEPRLAEHLSGTSFRHLCDGCGSWCKQLGGNDKGMFCSRCDMRRLRGDQTEAAGGEAR